MLGPTVSAAGTPVGGGESMHFWTATRRSTRWWAWAGSGAESFGSWLVEPLTWGTAEEEGGSGEGR